MATSSFLSPDVYDGADLKKEPARAGALDAFKYPSFENGVRKPYTPPSLMSSRIKPFAGEKRNA